MPPWLLRSHTCCSKDVGTSLHLTEAPQVDATEPACAGGIHQPHGCPILQEPPWQILHCESGEPLAQAAKKSLDGTFL